MIVNGKALLKAAPIKDMLDTKVREHGVSHGLSEAGYDIRIKQTIVFYPSEKQMTVDGEWVKGLFTIASTLEEFALPKDLVGVVHDKSTWARKGLSVRNTVVEPGWQGFLTLELVYDGSDVLTIPAGAGIAQILFSKIEVPTGYTGKYQNQADKPVAAKFE